MMIVGPGEGKRWLKEVLTQRAGIVDDMIVCLNNADKLTKSIVKKSGFWQYEDDREWGIYQPKMKTDLLAKVAKLKPDWVLPADADEIYDARFTRNEAERLAGVRSIGYYFAIINLWNDPEHYRHDTSFWNVRYFNFKETAKYGLFYEKKNLHCGLAPPAVYKYALHAPFMVKHYGLMLPEDRDKKIERYQKYDPNAVFIGREYYDKLKTNDLVRPFDEAVMHERIERDVASYNEKYVPTR